jgi:protein-tyrosine phosphatase
MKRNLEWIGLQVSKDVEPSRWLRFSGTKNFRDLGGYRTGDGKSVRWGVLYRSDSLHKLTNADLRRVEALNLSRVIDFRAEYEVQHKPDILPDGVRWVPLPMEDSSTKVWHEARDEMVKNIKTLDPAVYMVQTNVELATKFTSVYRQFYHELLVANGSPVLFHCAAGKDRTGFAAATLLRILGVTQDVILQDYLLTNRYLLGAYKRQLFLAGVLKGGRFADGIRGFMKADERYLAAAFSELEKEYGSFENYIRNGLGLSESDIDRLKRYYLV